MTPLSRRQLLGAAAAAAVVRPAAAQAFDVDVLVIGAGAAGFGAARELRRAGLTFDIVEARDRVGGRVFTDRSLGDPFDAGAQFIHWAERNPWREAAQELGVATLDDVMRGGWRIYRGGAQLPDDERLKRRGAFGLFSARLRAAEMQAVDQSFAQLVEGQPAEMRAAAEGLSLFSLGDDPEHASVADYAQLWAGDDLIVRDGYGSLVERALASYPVKLSTPVDVVRWDGAGVVARTQRGDIRARAAIITVSVGVLQSGGLRIEPSPPSEILAALDGLRMGAMTKIALAFDGDRLGLSSGFDLVDIGSAPGALLSTEAWGFERNLMVAVTGGRFARDLVASGEAAAVDFVLSRVVAMLGADARKHFKAGRLAGWPSDPYALGSYSLAKTGQIRARQALARPIGDRIWIAGEATIAGGAMTAGGATLAGAQAAQEIAGLLRKKG